MRTLLLSLCLLSTPLPATAGDAQQEIKSLQGQILQAIVKGDTAVL
jgi:hypothetical protein